MSKIYFIKFISLSFLLVMVSSCTFQKRRYTSGYYLNVSRVGSKANPIRFEKTGSHKPGNTVFGKKINTRNTQTQIVQTDSTSLHDKKISNSANGKSADRRNKIKAILKTNMPVISDFKDARMTKNTKKAKENHKILKRKPTMNREQKNNNNSKRNWAIIIGIALLMMALVAAFSAPAISGFFVGGNAALTALNVTTQISKYNNAVISWILIFFLDVLVSLGILKYYKRENNKIAFISSGLRLIYSVFLGAAIMQLLKVTLTTAPVAIYNSIKGFNTSWSLGLIVFGIHLISLGILFNKEGGKKWVNITIQTLLIVAGAGYIILNAGMLLVPNPLAFTALVQPVFLIPMILGEVFFAIWMLVKGKNN